MLGSPEKAPGQMPFLKKKSLKKTKLACLLCCAAPSPPPQPCKTVFFSFLFSLFETKLLSFLSHFGALGL